MIFFLLFVFALCLRDEEFVVTQDIIDFVNDDPTSTWKAGVNPVFVGKTWGEVKTLMGWLGHLNTFPKAEFSGKALPDEFDAYKKWPNCSHPIRDQGKCGSCWAFSAAEAMSDRFCIKGKDAILSPQDLVSCDKEEYACQGGYLSTEWEYFEKTGVVTDKCLPYKSGEGKVPKCTHKCEDSEEWSKSKHKTTKGSTKHYHNMESAMEGIYTDGPIQGGFTVYQDFFSYKSGVYTHKKGGVAGGHAIKPQGWGVDKGEKYWIIANSWGPSWGLKGYFWIKRGTDECGIEDQMYAGTPLI